MKKTRIKGDFDTTVDDKPAPIPRPYDIEGAGDTFPLGPPVDSDTIPIGPPVLGWPPIDGV